MPSVSARGASNTATPFEGVCATCGGCPRLLDRAERPSLSTVRIHLSCDVTSKHVQSCSTSKEIYAHDPVAIFSKGSSLDTLRARKQSYLTLYDEVCYFFVPIHRMLAMGNTSCIQGQPAKIGKSEVKLEVLMFENHIANRAPTL
eukprot:768802-Hanusia_phi.AAC.18